MKRVDHILKFNVKEFRINGGAELSRFNEIRQRKSRRFLKVSQGAESLLAIDYELRNGSAGLGALHDSANRIAWR